MLTIRKADADDAKDVAALIKEAVAWLARLGADQWQGPQFGDPDRIMISLGQGTTWAVCADGSLIGCVTLDESADPEFWSGSDNPASALYLHRMVVARTRAHEKVGSAILDWASQQAAARGKQWLRLDAWSSNSRLHAYYERQGFQNVRTLRLSHRGSGALFQRPAGFTLGQGPRLHNVSVLGTS